MMQICAEFITSHLLMWRNKYLHQPKVFDVLKYFSSHLRKESKHFGWRAGDIPVPPPWEGPGSGTTPISRWLQLPSFLWLCAKPRLECQEQELPHLVLRPLPVGPGAQTQGVTRGSARVCQQCLALCVSLRGGSVPVPHRDDEVMLIAVLSQLCADNEGPDDSIPPLHRAGLPPVMSPPAQIPFPCSPRVSRPADPLALPTKGHAEAAAAAQRLPRGHTGTAPCERRRSGAAAAVPARQTPCPGLEGAGASCSHPGRVWDPAQPRSWAVLCPLPREVTLR